jgi:hypothetical protein
MDDHKEMNMGEDGKLEIVQQFCYLGDMIGAGEERKKL